VTVPVVPGPWWEPFEPVRTLGGSIRVVDPAEVVALRRAVLWDGRPDLPAFYESDSDPSALHLGMVTPGGALAGCVTVLREALPGFASLHLVLMAVDPDRQRQGVGRSLVVAVQEAAEAAEAAGRNVWAAARLTALEFYAALGFQVMGDVFTGAMDLPHRRVLWRSR
jgi:ribosomal protein S18 acetylase RimI-like enzyme